MLATRRILGRPEPWVLAAIVALSLLIQATSGQFFTGNNLVDLARALVVPALFSVGCMMVIVSGGIDVSFTAIASLAMYVTDKILLAQSYDGNVLLAYAMSAGLGLLMGALNGVLIAFLRLPTLIVTLGTMSLYTGLMYGAFAASASDVPPAIAAHGKQILFTAVNQDSGLTSTMPAQVLILAGVLVFAFLLLRYTMLGRGVYAIGGDEAAAERAGFNVRGIKMFLYCFVGVLACRARGRLRPRPPGRRPFPEDGVPVDLPNGPADHMSARFPPRQRRPSEAGERLAHRIGHERIAGDARARLRNGFPRHALMRRALLVPA